MAGKKRPEKLQKILTNKALGDDMTIAIGDESFTLGELRSMDEASDGGSTAELQTKLKDLEAREGNLVTAQGALASTLQLAAEKLGVGIDDLIAGRLDAVPERRTTEVEESDDPLSAIDPKVLAALEKKFGVAEVRETAKKLQAELADTRKALGIALKVNMDDYYQNTWRELSPKIPKGSDGKALVELDLQKAMKYADDNQIKDRTGRLDLNRAFRDLTLEAQHKAEIEAAEQRGIERGRLGAAAASATRPGAQRAELLKPPVDDKGRTHTIEHQLQAALADSDIQRMLAGPMAEA